jgi:hypothetical protein
MSYSILAVRFRFPGYQIQLLAMQTALARQVGHTVVLDNPILAAKKIQEYIENG